MSERLCSSVCPISPWANSHLTVRPDEAGTAEYAFDRGPAAAGEWFVDWSGPEGASVTWRFCASSDGARWSEWTDTADETAFLLRVLLVHDYRRLLLRDPSLPGVLLPADWPGQSARLLCSELYRRLLAPSERHLDACFQLADGAVPEASALLHERFRDSDLLALPA